jgi:hypothetical protein
MANMLSMSKWKFDTLSGMRRIRANLGLKQYHTRVPFTMKSMMGKDNWLRISDPFGDYDKDKVINWFDCKPRNKHRDGVEPNMMLRNRMLAMSNIYFSEKTPHIRRIKTKEYNEDGELKHKYVDVYPRKTTHKYGTGKKNLLVRKGALRVMKEHPDLVKKIEEHPNVNFMFTPYSKRLKRDEYSGYTRTDEIDKRTNHRIPQHVVVRIPYQHFKQKGGATTEEEKGKAKYDKLNMIGETADTGYHEVKHVEQAERRTNKYLTEDERLPYTKQRMEIQAVREGRRNVNRRYNVPQYMYTPEGRAAAFERGTNPDLIVEDEERS